MISFKKIIKETKSSAIVGEIIFLLIIILFFLFEVSKLFSSFFRGKNFFEFFDIELIVLVGFLLVFDVLRNLCESFKKSDASRIP